MSLGSVIITFVMCILFNILLPTGDVGSDLNLMYQTLTFNLGSSFELEGCKSCYYKTDKEVYNPEKDLASNECKICLYNPKLVCGGITGLRNLRRLKKMNEMEKEKHSCSNNETFRRTSKYEWKVGECDEKNDNCCITQTTDIKGENPIQKLDPKKLFWECFQLTNEFDYCITSGKASGVYCYSFYFTAKFDEILEHRKDLVEKSSTNDSIFFYPYAKINQTWLMEEKNRPITDPDTECGLLIFRHNNKYKEQRQGASRYSHHCNEDSCLTHLKVLHRDLPISDLNEWRKRTDYIQGVRVGGVTCKLLRIFGTSILIPMLLNLTFNIVLFVNDFRDQKANIFEVIPLILLFYPQYKTIKFLTRFLFIHRDETLLNQQNEEHGSAVAPLEPFLESCLQVRN